MARLSGCTMRTVRFYEEAGLLRPLKRSNGRHRLFPSSELDRLLLVSDMRTAGLSLPEIRDLFNTKCRHDSARVAADELQRKLEAQIASLSRRIDVLQRMTSTLTGVRVGLESCRVCPSDGQNFPSQCGSCETMRNCANDYAKIGVLWDVAE